MTIYTNSGLVLSMQSAIAAAKTITAATNAGPGVLTSVAHGFVDGDIVLLRVSGMIQVNERMFVIVNKATDTFQLKNTVTGAVGIDTTNFGVFTSGTAEKLTLGTTIPGAQEFAPSGGDIKFVGTTTVSDTVDKQIVVGATAMSYSMTMQWDPSDTAQIAMLDAFTTRTSKGFRITWPNGRYAMFFGSVGYAGLPGGGSQGVTTSPAAVSMNGSATFGIP
jgi:hypothetical protein